MSGPPPPPPLAPPGLAGALPKPSLLAGPTLKDLVTATVQLAPEIEYVEPPPNEAVPDTLHEVSFEATTPSMLYNRLQLGVLLVIDIRPKEDFDRMHVRSAVSVDWAALSVSHPDLMSLEGVVAPLFKRRRDFAVYVYDDGGSLQNPTSRLATFLAALKADQRAALPVAVVEGGLGAVLSSHPFLIVGHPKFAPVELPSEIIEGFLFLGNYGTASSRQALDTLGITHIVNATDVCEMKFKEDPTFTYLQCPLDDHHSSDISQFFVPFLEFVAAAQATNGRVLVHCQQGMSRSATLVLLWLMSNGLSLKQAFDNVKRRRLFINPNAGFLYQLAEYENQHMGSQTIRFPEGHPLTMRCPYEWLGEDGQWHVRQMTDGRGEDGQDAGKDDSGPIAVEIDAKPVKSDDGPIKIAIDQPATLQEIASGVLPAAAVKDLTAVLQPVLVEDITSGVPVALKDTASGVLNPVTIEEIAVPPADPAGSQPVSVEEIAHAVESIHT
eukprot:m.24105 g.24105  ORF g.24105 m.24105 type:complete len:496 (-) comp3974_c0_seq2:102-1589(-)